MILLDTHIWIWWVQGDPRLAEVQRDAIEREEGGVIGVSAISCWEVALLHARDRLELPVAVQTWMRLALAYPGVRPLDLTPEVAVAATHLPGALHRDPADRFLVATALHYGCPLVTSDQLLLAYDFVTTIG